MFLPAWECDVKVKQLIFFLSFMPSQSFYFANILCKYLRAWYWSSAVQQVITNLAASGNTRVILWFLSLRGVSGSIYQAAIQVSAGAVVFSDVHLGKEPLSSSLSLSLSSPQGGRRRSQFSCWILVRTCSLCPEAAQGSFLASQVLTTEQHPSLKPTMGVSPVQSAKTASYIAKHWLQKRHLFSFPCSMV